LSNTNLFLENIEPNVHSRFETVVGIDEIFGRVSTWHFYKAILAKNTKRPTSTGTFNVLDWFGPV